MTCISFVVTCYNYQQYVSQSIWSCIRQNPANIDFEVIVVDDGSSDGSVEKINKYSETISFLQTPNLGLEQAFNNGLKMSKGDYVVRVDADDFLDPNYLQNISNYLTREVDILYGNYTRVDEAKKLKKCVKLPNFDVDEIVARGDFLATGTVVRRQLFDEFSMYQETTKNCGLENFELILNCIKREKVFKKIEANLFNYRVHVNNMSSMRREAICQYGVSLFEKLNLGAYKMGKYHPYNGSET